MRYNEEMTLGRTDARTLCMPLRIARCVVKQSLATTRYPCPGRVKVESTLSDRVLCEDDVCVSYPTELYLKIGVCGSDQYYYCSYVLYPVLSVFLLFVLLSDKRLALLAPLYLVPSPKRCVAMYVC